MAKITARAQAPARLIAYDRPPVRGAGDRLWPEGLAMERAGFAELLRRDSAISAIRNVPDGDGPISA